MSETMQKVLDEIQKLDPNRQEILAGYLLHIIETEEYLDDDDESDVEELLGRFVDADGNMDYDLLKSRGIVMSLDDLAKDT